MPGSGRGCQLECVQPSAAILIVDGPDRVAPASTVDVSAFRMAMGSYPTGVTVVTVASDDGNAHGITVNSFSSVSLDPMLVLVCLHETSRGVDLIERARAFVVNVLSAGQQDVSCWFADRHRPADSAMFDGLPFESGVTGCPILIDATASFECRLWQSYRAGDHRIVLGEVVALVHHPQLQPLIFHDGMDKSLERESGPGRTARRFERDSGVPAQQPHRRVA